MRKESLSPFALVPVEIAGHKGLQIRATKLLFPFCQNKASRDVEQVCSRRPCRSGFAWACVLNAQQAEYFHASRHFRNSKRFQILIPIMIPGQFFLHPQRNHHNTISVVWRFFKNGLRSPICESHQRLGVCWFLECLKSLSQNTLETSACHRCFVECCMLWQLMHQN